MPKLSRFWTDIPVSYREKFASSNGPCTILYGDGMGKIELGCFFGDVEYPIHDLESVPDNIANQGVEAIRSFAREQVNHLVESLLTHEELRRKRIRELHVFHEVSLDNVEIKGFVCTDMVKDKPKQLKLVMTEPFQLECYLHIRPSCFGESMYRARTFDEDGNLLPQEIERQEQALMELYEEERDRLTKPPEHPMLKALARRR